MTLSMVGSLHIGRATLVKVPDQLEVSFSPLQTKAQWRNCQDSEGSNNTIWENFPAPGMSGLEEAGTGLLIPFKWHSSWKPTFAFRSIAEEVEVGYLQNSTVRVRR